MLSRAELAAALAGVRGLVTMRADSFRYFDATLHGFWQSFWAAALAFPVWAILQAEQMAATPPHDPVRYGALQGIAYAISWLAYPLVMVRISSFLDRWPRYFTYMVAYNWFQLVQTVAWLPLMLLIASGADRDLVVLVWLVTHAALFAYSWFIARRGLEVEAGTAAALVIIDFLLGILIDGLSEVIAG